MIPLIPPQDAPVCGTDPIFIGCMPRSGSSLLRVMLGSHPNLAADAEIGWVSSKRPKLKLYNSYVRVTGGGFRRYINKEPKIISPQGLGILRRDIGDLYLIIIRRRSVDVLASYIKTSHLFHGQNMMGVFANDAADYIKGRRILSQFKWPVLEVNYESLVENAAETIATVCSFLNIQFARGMLHHEKYKHNRSQHPSDVATRKPIFKSSINQANTVFAKHDYKPSVKVTKICEKLDKIHGY